ncbi:unnamed protein product, partial [Phaeothamnion confervicola]
MLQEARDSPVPLLHIFVDFWTSKISNEKYIGIRVIYVNVKFETVSALLGVRYFAPDSDVVDQAAFASDTQLQWVVAVLAEHGLQLKHLAGSTSDSGSDIKHMCSVLLGVPWSWCLCHVINCALVEGMGTALDKSKSKNKPMRGLLTKVRKLAEHLSKSSRLRQKFLDLQFEQMKTMLKLPTDVPQRWLSTIRLLERVLAL